MGSSALSLRWRVIHWLIIGHFVVEIGYCAYLIFSVLQPAGQSGPLLDRAAEIPFEQLAARRLYAIECWIATAGLALYLALTELLPRILQAQRSVIDGRVREEE